MNLLLQCAELFDVARLGELGEQLHIDDADAGRLAGLFELLEQLVDLLQLLLDRQRLRHGHRLVAGELVLGRQLIDLVLLAQPLDHVHQRTGPRRLVVAGRVPQPLQVANLLGLARPCKTAARNFLGTLRFGRLIGKRLMRPAGRPFSFRSGPGSSASALRASRSAHRCSAPGPRSGWDRAGSPGPAPPRSARGARRT